MTTTETPVKHESWMTLVPAHDGAHDGFSPVVGVRWQIADAAVEEMAQREATTPYLVLAISFKHEHDGEVVWNVEELFVYEVADLMTYLTLHRAGQYRVASALVWGFGKEALELLVVSSAVIDRKTGDFNPVVMDVATRLSAGRRHHLNAGYLTGETLDVVITAAFFDKKPTGWFADWVNFGFRESPRDTCEFRKRIPLSLFFTPLTFLLIFVLARSLCFTCNLLLGRRGLRPRELFRWDAEFDAVLGETGSKNLYDSVFFYRRSGEGGQERESRALFMYALAPFWVAWGYLYLTAFHDVYPLFRLVISLAAMMFIATALFIVEAIAILISKWRLAKQERRAAREAQEAERAAAAAHLHVEVVQEEEEDPRIARARNLRSSLGPAISDGTPVVADVRALPKERRTVRLKFTAFKARMCRIYTP